jgi:hypothetical protein
MDWVDLSSVTIPSAVIKQVRGEDARRFKVIPVAFGETGLVDTNLYAKLGMRSDVSISYFFPSLKKIEAKEVWEAR